MAAAGDWGSYFYPETYNPDTGNGVMRNVPGIRDAYALRDYEYRMTSARRTELDLHPELVARIFDGEHVKGIHRQLFQDVYDWAGQYRTVNMVKGTTGPFADAHNGAIDRYLGDVQKMVNRTDWAKLDHPSFAEKAAEVFVYLNQAHPMREGNGRTTKAFMEHLAERSQFTLIFDRVDPMTWDLTSAATRPPEGVYVPDHRPMVAVFENVAVKRDYTLIHEGGRITQTPQPQQTEPQRPPTLAERISRKVSELREARKQPKPGTDTGRGAPELGDGTPKPDRQNKPKLGR